MKFFVFDLNVFTFSTNDFSLLSDGLFTEQKILVSVVLFLGLRSVDLERFFVDQ